MIQKCQYENCDLPVRPGKTYCAGHVAIRFIEEYCTHTKGRWDGHSFCLIPWEYDLIFRAFGTLNKNGKRQYRTIYCEIPKKNGKTEIGAAIGLIGIVADQEQGAEVYSAAGDRSQASLIYRAASRMVQNNPVLSNRLTDLISVKRIIDYKTNSFYQVLSSEAYTKHGINPSVIIFDELHAQPNRELYDVLTEGTDIAREQQLILILTTAGVYDKESIGWEVHDYARQVKAGIIDDPTFLPIMYCADKDNDDWEDPKVWAKVNPSLNYIFDIENLKKHYKKVKANPVTINNFLRYRLNIWTSQLSKFFNMDEWDACGGRIDKKKLLKRPCYGGLDLSSTQDLSALILLFPPILKQERWKVLCHFYIPEDRIMERVRKDNVNYDIWVKSKLITATPGKRIDYAFIRKDINNAASLFHLMQVAYDPWGAIKLATELDEEDGIEMVEHRQGWKSMSPPTKELAKMISSREINHGGNPVLRWCADNMVVKIDAAENMKPDKSKVKERIDGVVALIMALGAAILAKGEGPSRYEEEDAEVIAF